MKRKHIDGLTKGTDADKDDEARKLGQPGSLGCEDEKRSRFTDDGESAEHVRSLTRTWIGLVLPPAPPPIAVASLAISAVRGWPGAPLDTGGETV